MKKIWPTVIGVALIITLLIGCGPNEQPASSAVLNITLSILPQQYFVERIGGENVAVNVMVLPGESPATYEPKPDQLRALSEAQAYVSIGVPFEQAWLERISSANPDMLMIDTTQGIERLGDPEHPDPHIWLSPRLVKIQAQTIYDALVRLDPEHQTAYQANLERFLEDIDALDADIRSTLSGLEQRKFMVFHPSWGYFARDYDLEMIPIEIGGQEPSAAELTALIERAQAEDIRVIFAQPQFSTKKAQTIAEEIDGEVLLIDPLAPDWLDNLRQVTATFADVLGK
jgi:zinc transport system substrate-binding protein